VKMQRPLNRTAGHSKRRVELRGGNNWTLLFPLDRFVQKPNITL
jgi:hypothetical protein